MCQRRATQLAVLLHLAHAFAQLSVTTEQLLSKHSSTRLDKAIRRHGGAQYRQAAPFPHAVMDGLFPASVLQALSDEIPEPVAGEGVGPCGRSANASVGRCFHTFGREYKKALIDDRQMMGPVTRDTFQVLKSPQWLTFLERLTGITGLVPDPAFEGSGVHMIAPGGMLQVHADFGNLAGSALKEHDRKRIGATKLRRRVNTFLFLNNKWPEEYGGHLELWERNMSSCRQRILPAYGRFVTFSSTDFSYHGHPHPLTAPPGRLRRSLALYYYTVDAPEEECAGPCWRGHSTLWQKPRGCASCRDAACRAYDDNCDPLARCP
jgi:hypothetical protein